MALGVLTNGGIRFTMFARQDIDSNVIIPMDGNFHYVAATIDSSNFFSIYLDGILRQTGSFARSAGNSVNA